MRAYARPIQQPRWASCEPRQRASTLRRIRRHQRHAERQRARLAIAGALALLLALPAAARAEEPAAPEGRIVDLKAGEAAPFEGSLVDEAYARVLLERRRAAERTAELALAETKTCTAKLADCQAGPALSTWVAVVATAAAVALVGGLYLGVQVAR